MRLRAACPHPSYLAPLVGGGRICSGELQPVGERCLGRDLEHEPIGAVAWFSALGAMPWVSGSTPSSAQLQDQAPALTH